MAKPSQRVDVDSFVRVYEAHEPFGEAEFICSRVGSFQNAVGEVEDREDHVL